MGMYTEFKFQSKVQRDIPVHIHRALQTFLMRDAPLDEEKLREICPGEPLFEDYRVCMLGGTYDGIVITVTADLKNYTGTIEKFLDWIVPYLDKDEGTVVGTTHYEEDEHPLYITLTGDGWDSVRDTDNESLQEEYTRLSQITHN